MKSRINDRYPQGVRPLLEKLFKEHPEWYPNGIDETIKKAEAVSEKNAKELSEWLEREAP